MLASASDQSKAGPSAIGTGRGAGAERSRFERRICILGEPYCSLEQGKSGRIKRELILHLVEQPRSTLRFITTGGLREANISKLKQSANVLNIAPLRPASDAIGGQMELLCKTLRRRADLINRWQTTTNDTSTYRTGMMWAARGTDLAGSGSGRYNRWPPWRAGPAEWRSIVAFFCF